MSIPYVLRPKTELIISAFWCATISLKTNVLEKDLENHSLVSKLLEEASYTSSQPHKNRVSLSLWTILQLLRRIYGLLQEVFFFLFLLGNVICSTLHGVYVRIVLKSQKNKRKSGNDTKIIWRTGASELTFSESSWSGRSTPLHVTSCEYMRFQRMK